MSLTADDKAALLGRLPLFTGISAESMNRLAAVAGEQEFGPGQFIVRQGQIGIGLYVITSGSVDVIHGADDVIATLSSGDFFGEMSVIDQQPRGASVQATSATEVLAVASWDFLALIESDPAFALNLIKALAGRVRVAGEHHRH